jgi:hypothetical protein
VSTRYESDLKAAMRRLADVAGPADLTDAALRGATGARRRRAVLSGLAAAIAVAALSLPFVIWDRPPAESPGQVWPELAAPTPSLGACQGAPMVNPTTKEVAENHWPQFVRKAVGLLPARDDYVLQSAYDLCNHGESGLSNAYAVINLGHGREHGHLTVDLFVYETSGRIPASCADLNATIAAGGDWRVLFCQDATNAQPLLYGIAYLTYNTTVGAVYPDHRAVVMERNGEEAVGAISVDDLKAVVSHRDLLDLIPVASGPLPTASNVVRVTVTANPSKGWPTWPTR